MWGGGGVVNQDFDSLGRGQSNQTYQKIFDKIKGGFDLSGSGPVIWHKIEQENYVPDDQKIS